VRVPGFIHPAALGLHFLEDALGLTLEDIHVHRSIVVADDEDSRREEVVQHLTTDSHLGGHAGHTRAAKAVEDDVTRLGVVLDEGDDGLAGHLGMVRVGVVDGVVLALGDVGHAGFAVVVVGGFVT
jgi:hypothetical protein